MTDDDYKSTSLQYFAQRHQGLAIQKFNETRNKRGRLLFREPQKIKDKILCEPNSEPERVASNLWAVFGRLPPVTVGFQVVYHEPWQQERQGVHFDDRQTKGDIDSRTKSQLLELGPFAFSWSAFGALDTNNGQGLCFAKAEHGSNIHDPSTATEFLGFPSGALVMVLGNTAHGGSGSSQFECPTKHIPGVPDIKFFIPCAGLKYAPNANNGTVIRQQLYLTRLSDQELTDMVQMQGSFEPSIYIIFLYNIHNII